MSGAPDPRTLPLLPTLGVGSYASPAWLVASRERIREGAFGSDDVEETFEDAVRIAVMDQLEAGLDIVSDGEMRRQRFVYEMYDRLGGLRRVPPRRRIGVPGYDMAPRFVTTERVTAPSGLGVVAELRALRRLAPGAHLKVAIPGALTFAAAIEPEAGYSAGGPALVDDLVAIVRAELAALAYAGAHHVQLDEPALARPPLGLTAGGAVEIVNRTLDDMPGPLAVHVCFGNNAGRPSAERTLGRLLPAIADLRCRFLVLEFANRQMAEVARLGDLAATHELAAGVVDVKSFHVETAEEVAARIRLVLGVVPPERLAITADCGFSALPRWLARAKLRTLVAGTRLVRAALA